MSASVTLTLRAPLEGSVSVHALSPHRLAEMSEQEIAGIPVTTGRRQVALGDLFTVHGERSAQVRVLGSTSHVEGLGAAMRDGELVIEGDAGPDLGARMTGGVIHLRGSAAQGAGAAMKGGVLRIDGNAGDYLGAALPGAATGMSGGEIIVTGSAGHETGARLRRGLIVVGGDTGPASGRAMIAGSVIVLGNCGEHPGRANKRGSIIACGSVSVPVTYRYACTYQPVHVRVTLLYLKRRYGLPLGADCLEGTFRRYCGDAGDPGKGEILHLCTR